MLPAKNFSDLAASGPAERARTEPPSPGVMNPNEEINLNPMDPTSSAPRRRMVLRTPTEVAAGDTRVRKFELANVVN